MTISVLQWDDLRRSSPSFKAYYKQLDSLLLKNNVLYHHMEAIHDRDHFDQLLLPPTLRDQFLSLVHNGIAGHLGAFKTRMHVGTCHVGM